MLDFQKNILYNEYLKMMNNDVVKKEIDAHCGDVSKIIWHKTKEMMPPIGREYTIIFKENKESNAYCTGTYTYSFDNKLEFASDEAGCTFLNMEYWGFWDRFQFGTWFDGKWFDSSDMWKRKLGQNQLG